MYWSIDLFLALLWILKNCYLKNHKCEIEGGGGGGPNMQQTWIYMYLQYVNAEIFNSFVTDYDKFHDITTLLLHDLFTPLCYLH